MLFIYLSVFFPNSYIGKSTAPAQVQSGAGVGAESAKRAGTSAGAAAERKRDRVAKSTVLGVMKGMDVIEVTKALSEYRILFFSSFVLQDVFSLPDTSGSPQLHHCLHQF